MSSDQHEPPRLLASRDGDFAELLPGLARAREQGPSAEQLASLCTSVAARAASAASGDAAPGDEATRAPQTHRPSKPSSGASGAPGVVGASTGTAKLIKLVAGGVLLSGTLWVAWPRAAQHIPSALPARSAASTPAQLPEPPAPGASAAQASSPATPIAREPAPRRSAAGDARSAPRAALATAEVGDVAAELALLKLARADVRANPAHALALTAEHRARFAQGSLAEEREVIAIEALLELGRKAAAQERARAFFAAYPSSAHTRRVHALLLEHGAALSHANASPSPHSPR